MKKKALSIICAGLIAISAAACSSVSISDAPSDGPSGTSSQAERSDAEEDLLSSEAASLLDEEKDILSEFMKNELGESSPITVISAEEPREIEGTASSFYSVEFTAGSRKLTAAFTIDSDHKKTLTAISKADDAMHYYYYRDAEKVNALGVVTIHVYDYNTDQEIGLDAVSSVQQQEMESAVSGILADLQNITVEQSETNDTVLSLNVAIDSPYSTDLAVCAEHFYYDSLQFIVQYLTLDPLPYQNLAFNIVIDGEDVGSMVMFSAPEVGLIGTTTPIIADEEVLQVFSEKYDELMGEVDQSNFTQ